MSNNRLGYPLGIDVPLWEILDSPQETAFRRDIFEVKTFSLFVYMPESRSCI